MDRDKHCQISTLLVMMWGTKHLTKSSTTLLVTRKAKLCRRATDSCEETVSPFLTKICSGKKSERKMVDRTNAKSVTCPFSRNPSYSTTWELTPTVSLLVESVTWFLPTGKLWKYTCQNTVSSLQIFPYTRTTPPPLESLIPTNTTACNAASRSRWSERRSGLSTLCHSSAQNATWRLTCWQTRRVPSGVSLAAGCSTRRSRSQPTWRFTRKKNTSARRAVDHSRRKKSWISTTRYSTRRGPSPSASAASCTGKQIAEGKDPSSVRNARSPFLGWRTWERT